MRILKQLKISNNIIFNGEVQMIFRPLCMFFVTHKYLLKHFGSEKIKQIYSDSSLFDCYIWYKEIEKLKNLDNVLKIKTFLSFISMFGFGDLELKHFKNNTLLFSHNRYIISKLYESIHSEKPEILIEETLSIF
ncbi:MAG: hypothetical protein HRU03_04110, partial [Nanoarchaeales archaeon]|nr:hypothetical protein [Nanoarchaeales archaeon]